MPKVVNLNKLVTGRSSRRIGDTTLVFDTECIQKKLISRISRSDTKYVCGCAAWFTNTKIIEALSRLCGVSIICTRDKVAKTTPKWTFRKRRRTWSARKRWHDQRLVHHTRNVR